MRIPCWMDPKKATVLVTGGAGYIGSHTVLKLLENGNTVVVVDNCSNCYRAEERFMPESLLRVQEITGKSVKFISADVLNREDLDMTFLEFQVDCVMHFAGLKSVGESCREPLKYYRQNVAGSLNLLDVIRDAGCRRIIYSSSATVYGNPEKLPLVEESPTGKCTSPYGWTKFLTENILQDLCRSDSSWKILSLRYFNPVGAHESGRIGEDPNGPPNNLMPNIAQVATGKLEELKVFGNDYDTRDGTGIRDYIHIQDLAEGHVRALEKILQDDFCGFRAYNLGTGTGYSVLEVVKAFEHHCGQMVQYRVVDRREGDVGESYCDSKRANRELNWLTKKTLKDMCQDMWRWQEMNPGGYKGVVDK